MALSGRDESGRPFATGNLKRVAPIYMMWHKIKIRNNKHALQKKSCIDLVCKKRYTALQWFWYTRTKHGPFSFLHSSKGVLSEA